VIPIGRDEVVAALQDHVRVGAGIDQQKEAAHVQVGDHGHGNVDGKRERGAGLDALAQGCRSPRTRSRPRSRTRDPRAGLSQAFPGAMAPPRRLRAYLPTGSAKGLAMGNDIRVDGVAHAIVDACVHLLRLVGGTVSPIGHVDD